jgi:Tfp pilus assembly PilM family ATPase
MFDFSKWTKSFLPQRTAPSVLGVDFGATGVRIIRISCSSGRFVITHAWMSRDPNLATFTLPNHLHARAVGIAVSDPDIISKLLAIPSSTNVLADVPFANLLGISNPQAFRIAMELDHSTALKTHALVAAIPETTAVAAIRPFSHGFPAPQSLEVAGLAAINGMILENPAIREQGAILLDLGAETATVAIIVLQKLAFTRQFRIGANAIMRKLGESLGMDGDTAREAVGEGLVDAVDQVQAAYEPLARQINLGRDFVSRSHNVRTEHLVVSGGLFQTPFWTQPLEAALGVDVTVWNPLAVLPVTPGALTPELVAQGCRFAAAAGAAIAALEIKKP